MRKNKLIWIEQLHQFKADLKFIEGKPICAGNQCDHNKNKRFHTILTYYLHILEAKLLPCLVCPVLDDKWEVLQDALNSVPKGSLEAQRLITIYLSDLNVHFEYRTARHESISVRNDCHLILEDLQN